MESITKKDLENYLAATGRQHYLQTESAAHSECLLKGKLSFDKLPSGISIHCADIIETQEATSSAEIPAGLSINVLIEGHVDFALGSQRYQIATNEKPMLFVLSTPSPQVFTRFLHKGEQTKKLNISLTKSWLVQRCQSREDHETIDKILCVSTPVSQLNCPIELAELAHKTIASHNQKNLVNQLQLEQHAIEIFNQCFPLLMNEALVATQPNNQNLLSTPLGSPERYESKIIALIDKQLSLNDIATKAGASVSTLQRYFKKHHHMTLAEFIRLKKLERARHQIIIERLSIGEAAYIAGYNHSSNFITAFKKQYGVTPAELLKANSEVSLTTFK